MDLMRALTIEKEKQERLRKIVFKNVIAFATSTGVVLLLRYVLPTGPIVRVLIFVTGFFTGEFMAELIVN